MQCLHSHNLSQALLDQCKTSCAVMEQHRVDQASGKCVEVPGAERSAEHDLLPQERSADFLLFPYKHFKSNFYHSAPDTF